MIYLVVFILMCVIAWASYDLHNQDVKKNEDDIK
jgi:hypothetical protein